MSGKGFLRMDENPQLAQTPHSGSISRPRHWTWRPVLWRARSTGVYFGSWSGDRAGRLSLPRRQSFFFFRFCKAVRVKMLSSKVVGEGGNNKVRRMSGVS